MNEEYEPLSHVCESVKMQHVNQFDPPVLVVCVFLCMRSIYTDFFRSWCVCNLSSEKIAVILKIEVL